jgi:hypothetical protein
MITCGAWMYESRRKEEKARLHFRMKNEKDYQKL